MKSSASSLSRALELIPSGVALGPVTSAQQPFSYGYYYYYAGQASRLRRATRPA